MKGAENQAAILLDTFKNVGLEAGLSLSKNISESLAQVAVTAGGTAEDIKAALAATPFISQTLGEDLRKQLSGGILEFQRDLRRAGLGEEFGNIAKDILSGQADILQLVNSGTPIGSLLGKELLDRGGVVNLSELTPAKRTELLAEILNDKSLRDLIQRIGKETSGYRGILEDLNTNLFNPRKGVFGYLRDVSLSVEGITTNVFKETTNLVETIFGPEGLFLNFFRNIAKVFGIEDPLRFIIRNIRFLTEQFERLNKFIQSESFQDIIKQIRDAFERTKQFFINIYNAVVNNDQEAEASAVQFIKDIGSAIRAQLRKLADAIRSQEFGEDASTAGTIVGSITEEIIKTLKTLIVEVGGAIVAQAGTIAGELLPTINQALNNALSGVFGGLSPQLVKAAGSFLPGPLGTLSRVSLATDAGQGGNLAALAAAAFAPQLIRGGRGVVGGLRRTGRSLRNIPRRLQAGRRGGPLAFFSNLTQTAERTFQGSVLSKMDTIINLLATGQGYDPGMFGGDAPRSNLPGGGREDRRRRRPRRGRGIGERIRRAVPSGRNLNARRLALQARTQDALGGFGRRARDIITGDDYLGRAPAPQSRGFRQYTAPIGPAEMGSDYPWQRTRSGYQPYMVSEYDPRVQDRYNRRMAYRQSFAGRRAGFMRGARRFGRGALIAGGITAGIGLLSGGAAQAGEIDPETGAPKPTALQAAGNVLGGGVEGAMLGATIGSIVPGVGTAAGAVIGGIIGGVAPLFDKGVRDAIGKFITDIGSSLLKVGTDFVNGIKNAVMGGFETIKDWASGIDWKNVLLDTILPGRGIARTIAQSTGASEGDSWMAKAIRFLTGAQEGNAEGANFIGPTLAQESRVSGAKAMVVNDREFVIPQGGFSTLANLVALKNTPSALVSGAAGANAAPQINLTINVSGVFSADDLEDTLRDPVSNIVEDAYRRASSARTNQVNTRA